MELIVIYLPSRNNIIAVVEKPAGMSEGAIALAWAKGEGYESFPSDLSYQGGDLTTAGNVFRKITPIAELNRLETESGDPNPQLIPQ